MESHQVLTGFILQIIERLDFSVDVALVRKKEIAKQVSINENLSTFSFALTFLLQRFPLTLKTFDVQRKFLSDFLLSFPTCTKGKQSNGKSQIFLMF